MKWRHRCSPLICGVCLIAGSWLGSVFVLVVHRAGDAGESPETLPVSTATDRPRAETSSDAAEPVNRCVDWELTKVLVEMDIRNPSPEHEAFLREYNCTKKHYEKGE